MIECFNSRAREGRDPDRSGCSFPTLVSIHAPARGATVGGEAVPGRIVGFNSRAREGRDLRQLDEKRRTMSFNSRAREGRDG